MLFVFLILQSGTSFADNSPDYDFDLSYNTEETNPALPKNVTKTNIPGMAESVPKKKYGSS